MYRSTIIFASAALVAWSGVASGQNRSVDGIGNNLNYPNWGAANTQLMRVAASDYVDGSGDELLGSPRRENPRVISNAVVSQSTPRLNLNGLTNFVWQWGQFLDHDIDLTESNEANGTAPVPIPMGDVLGPKPMPFNRSNFDPATGTSVRNPRQQINEVTSYLDASNVYGSDMQRADWLRASKGGRLKTGRFGLLPFNDGTMPNAGTPEQPDFSELLFVAGDIRSNEQVGLTAMHTLFVREHNRLADLLQTHLPTASDEQLYQTARRIVGAEIQAITYGEFLPAILGDVKLPTYVGYQPDVDATIVNEFSTAFYRFGHTMLPPELTLIEPDGTVSGELPLRDAFFVPSFFDDPRNVDRVLGGLIMPAQEIDAQVVDDVRNFLFGPPGAGGFDLASLNIQRGRDHGLPDYNSLRDAYGLLRKEKIFSDGVLDDGVTPNGVTANVELARNLTRVYGSVDNIDAWVGGLAEDPQVGSPVSELVGVAMVDQFARLRDGDRFFYLNDPLLNMPEVMAVIDLETISLKQIVEWNTLARFELDNVFLVPEPASWFWVLMVAALFVRPAGCRREH